MMYCIALLLYTTQAQWWMGELKINGNDDTPDCLIRHYLTIRSGKSFTLLELMENQKCLEKTNIWASVRVTIESSETPSEYKNIIVSVKENRWNWVYRSFYDFADWLIYRDSWQIEGIVNRLKRHLLP